MPEFFAGHAMVSRLLRTFLVAMALSATWSRAVHADNVEERPTIVVALVASDPGDSATVLLDMLVAQFSIEPNVRMVERRQIAQVLSEQGLQLAVASPDECVRVGTLVGADLIGVLEMNSDGKQPIGLMLFETSSTRRVGDSTLRPSMEEACEDAADGLRTALRAMRDGAGVTLSVLAVRNADLPPAFTSLADGLVQLWERRLLGAGRITVLERARLEAMNRERDLVGARDANQLQHSVILAEAQLHRGHGPNQLALSIRLTDGKGKLLSNLTAQAQEEHAIELVDELVRQFDTWRDDGAASIAQVNRKGEAGRFYVEGVRNLDGPYPERGLRAAEAAYALSATDHHRKLLATSLIWFVQRQLGADHKNPFVRNPTELTARQVADVLPLAQRSLDLTYLTLERARASNRNALSQHVYKDSFQWNHALEGFITAVNGSPQFPEIHQAITHFKQQLRRYHGALYERLDTLRQREADPWPGRWSALRLEAPKRLRASSTMEQYSEDQVQLWARSITPFTPEAAATLKPETLFHLHEALRWLHSPQPRDWSLGGGTAPVYWGEWTWAQRSTIMNPLWRQLEQHPWIMLQWHGRLARSADAVRQRGVSATDPPHKDERTPAGDAGKRQFTSLVSELRDWLTEPPPNENTSLIDTVAT